MLDSEAKQYAGLSYLKLKDYNSALECFSELSSLPGLQSNRGDMLQAATLLQRNEPGDKQKAKGFLEKVITEDEEGSREAKEILQHY